MRLAHGDRVEIEADDAHGRERGRRQREHAAPGADIEHAAARREPGGEHVDPFEGEPGRSVGTGSERLPGVDHELDLARRQRKPRRTTAARRGAGK